MITETKTRRVDPGITIFEISGRLSLGNSLMSVENSIKRMIDEGARKLVLDLTGLSAIDSSGIGLLVTSASHMEQSGGHVRVAGANRPRGEGAGARAPGPARAARPRRAIGLPASQRGRRQHLVTKAGTPGSQRYHGVSRRRPRPPPGPYHS